MTKLNFIYFVKREIVHTHTHNKILDEKSLFYTFDLFLSKQPAPYSVVYYLSPPYITNLSNSIIMLFYYFYQKYFILYLILIDYVNDCMNDLALSFPTIQFALSS